MVELFKTVRSSLLKETNKILDKSNLMLIRKHYYSTIPDNNILSNEIDDWWSKSKLVGLKIDDDQMIKNLRKLFRDKEYYKTLPSYEEARLKKYGPGFGYSEGMVLAAMIRYHKPKKIIEIGAGLSTYYGTLALDSINGGSYTCIEPNPYPELYTLNHVENIIKKRAEKVDVKVFESLEKGDILFIDSTHIVKLGGEVIYLYLEVLPRLKKGVIVHIHDIAFPFPILRPEIAIHEKRYWTEWALAQAFLAFNKSFKIELCMSYLHYYYPEVLSNILPLVHKDPWPPLSLWISRIH